MENTRSTRKVSPRLEVTLTGLSSLRWLCGSPEPCLSPERGGGGGGGRNARGASSERAGAKAEAAEEDERRRKGSPLFLTR